MTDSDEDASDELTYAEAGVDIEESEAATAALVGAVSGVADTTEYAGLVDLGTATSRSRRTASARNCSSRRRWTTTPPSASTAWR